MGNINVNISLDELAQLLSLAKRVVDGARGMGLALPKAEITAYVDVNRQYVAAFVSHSPGFSMVGNPNET